MSSTRERRKSGKNQMKEKVVQVYEKLFLGQDITEGRPGFWDEFFLLKVNTKCLIAHFEKMNIDELACLKPHLNRLFLKCIEALHHKHRLRVANAIQTISCISVGVISCKRPPNTASSDLLHILMEPDKVESSMQNIIETCNGFLLGDSPYRLKYLSIHLLLSIICACPNLKDNPLAPFLFMDGVFESLTLSLTDPILRQHYGKEICNLLALLMQLGKFEDDNPWRFKFSLLDNELILHGFSCVISLSLADYNRQYQIKTAEPQGFFSSISSMIGNVLVGAEKTVESIIDYKRIRAQDSLLLALYEAVHINRPFISTLTSTHTPADLPITPTTPLSPSAIGNTFLLATHSHNGDALRTSNDDRPSIPTPTEVNNPSFPVYGQAQPPISPVDTSTLEAHVKSEISPVGIEIIPPEPTNLMVVFLEYCSIVMQDLKDSSRLNSSRLCFLILVCISEDQYASSLLHDIHLNFKVRLHKMPMRHRKPPVEKGLQSRPLACAVLDLTVEFLQCHLMKSLPVDLFNLCLIVIHRLLCYQKRTKLRLEYDWKHLWTSLFNLIRFILSIEQHMNKTNSAFGLLHKTVTIFNLFITYGDAFLPTPNAYDELYYEIIRMHHLFESLYTMVNRYSVSQGSTKEMAQKLSTHLDNIRGIINHFTPKIDAWAVENNQAALTEDQVLELVRGNYDTLTLKLQDELDHFERYSESVVEEKEFFHKLVRSISINLRSECLQSSFDLQQHLHELSSFS